MSRPMTKQMERYWIVTSYQGGRTQGDTTKQDREQQGAKRRRDKIHGKDAKTYHFIFVMGCATIVRKRAKMLTAVKPLVG
jgi:hypothetical protein